jgi:diaminopimelate epimerase
MRRVAFRKYHGLGNDFVVLDGITRQLPVEELVMPDVAAGICQRHTGVGADGLLLILPPSDPKAAQARMRVINADGSEPEMCGNGIRCVAKALHDHIASPSQRALQITVETGAGPLTCELTLGPEQLVSAVRVDMGRPLYEREALPMEGTGRFVDQQLPGDVEALSWTAVSMGNPHLVTFVDDQQVDLRAMAARIGPVLERHPLFPNRTNVEIARLEERRAVAWVWERGCGITQACGTGACAVAAAAAITDRHSPGRSLSVQLPGGLLEILVESDLGRVWMKGPAVEVFSGELVLQS